MNFLTGVNQIIEDARKSCVIEENAERFLTETLSALKKMHTKRVANIKELIFYVQNESIYVKAAEDDVYNIYIQKDIQNTLEVFNSIRRILKLEKPSIKSEDEKKIVISIILD